MRVHLKGSSRTLAEASPKEEVSVGGAKLTVLQRTEFPGIDAAMVPCYAHAERAVVRLAAASPVDPDPASLVLLQDLAGGDAFVHDGETLVRTTAGSMFAGCVTYCCVALIDGRTHYLASSTPVLPKPRLEASEERTSGSAKVGEIPAGCRVKLVFETRSSAPDRDGDVVLGTGMGRPFWIKANELVEVVD